MSLTMTDLIALPLRNQLFPYHYKCILELHGLIPKLPLFVKVFSNWSRYHFAQEKCRQVRLVILLSGQQ